MGKTASYVKDKYNAKTYDRYTFYMRKDEPLNDRLQADKQNKLISQAIKDALSLYYLGEEKQTMNSPAKKKQANAKLHNETPAPGGNETDHGAVAPNKGS